MEKEKVVKIKFSTCLLILSIIIISIMSCLTLKLYLELNQKVINLEKINTLPKNTNHNDMPENNIVESTQNNTSKKEKISIESDYGKVISNYISEIWVWPEAYSDCIAEFSNIKSAPKDYLAVCASLRTMSKVGYNNIYDAKSTLKDFNSSLIELFGNNADGLINASDIENVFFVEKNSDGTYHFFGFDGSELRETKYFINKIEKKDNIFYVSQYECKIEIDEMPLDLEIGRLTHRHIYDRNNNLILNTTITTVYEGDTKSCKEYDENGEEIDSIGDLLLSKYKNKLSIRNIELEYNSSNNSFIMLNNKLQK